MPDQPAVSALSRCLVEGDEAALRRARRLRRKALLLAVAVEAALVAAMLLAPLLATSELPNRRNLFLITPPPRGTPQGPAERSRTGDSHSHGQRRGPSIERQIFEPPRIPDRIDESGSLSQSAPELSGLPPGSGPSGVIGGNDPAGPADTRRPTLPPEPTPPVQKKPRPVSEGVQAALLIHRVDPVYPILAKQIGLAGTVSLRAITGTDGFIRELELVSGNPILVHAAMLAVAQWRYRPTLLNNQPVEVETHISVVFQLRR